MQNKKSILLTFDYELFLGKDSGSVRSSLIDPVSKILDILKMHNAKAVFFVDSSYLLRLKKEGSFQFELVEQQIKNLIRHGHNVELHLHPHWMNAIRIGERWSLEELTNYRIHSLPEDLLERHFTEALELLNSIVKKERDDYEITSFRAGGWCIQPFDKLKKSFSVNNIQNDFSVLPGLKESSDARYFDYSKFDNLRKRISWKFSEDTCVEDKNGRFLEVPCTVVRIPLYKYLMNKIAQKKVKRIGDGQGAVSKTSMAHKVSKVICRRAPLNIDFMTVETLKYLIDRGARNRYVIVGHPKLLSDHGLDCLSYLLTTFDTLTIDDVNKGQFCES